MQRRALKDDQAYPRGQGSGWQAKLSSKGLRSVQAQTKACPKGLPDVSLTLMHGMEVLVQAQIVLGKLAPRIPTP